MSPFPGPSSSVARPSVRRAASLVLLLLGALAAPALGQTFDPRPSAEAVAACRPGEVGDVRVGHCLEMISRFGDAPPSRALIERFATAPNAQDRARAATALGLFVPRDAATPQLRKLLQDREWSVAYAAARSLGWIGARAATRDLRRVSKHHWLPEVRAQAGRTLEAFTSSTGRLPSPVPLGRPIGPARSPGMRGESPGDGLAQFVPSTFLSRLIPTVACESGQWRWRGRIIAARKPRREAELQTPAGRLVGNNRGEWGGELIWRPQGGAPVVLTTGNITDIALSSEGFVASEGLSHLGVSAGSVIRGRYEDGAWRLSWPFSAPLEVEGIEDLGGGEYAAWSGGRLYVLNDKGPIRDAVCTGREQPDG